MTDPPDEPIVSEAHARALWHRAAELQAAAARRLEERSRTLAVRADAPDAAGYRLRDVEAAAVEAGIEPEFVRLALREMEDEAEAEGASRVAAVVLGTEARSADAARTLRAKPAEVYEAMRRVLPAPPYRLALVEALGDPLDGGLLVFDIPPYNYNGGNAPLASAAMYGGVKRITVMLRPLPDEPDACEVVASADLRAGRSGNALGSGVLSAMSGGLGALFGFGIGAQALAIGGALLALPVTAGAVAAGGAAALGFRGYYRWSIRKMEEALRQMLRAVEADARTGGAFSAPTRRGDDDDRQAPPFVQMPVVPPS